ncbi:MAG: XRE family transcriptional regulator [Deltaproteobacteria bacterium]|jgi:transcriptional regulator with XRE-family HTH domain|nr:XRE family transcriptional regulator [Deltaproteobacteria bacterium]
MKKFRDFLNEELKDKELAKKYYKELEKTRIAVEITYFREKTGITQKELAKMINTTQSVIARLENPEYKKYSLTTLRKVAEALKLELTVSFKEKGVEKYEEKNTVTRTVFIPYPTPAQLTGSMYKYNNLIQEEIQKEAVA